MPCSVLNYLQNHYLRTKLDLKPGSAVQLSIAVSLMDRWHGAPVRLGNLNPELVTDFLRHLSANGRSAKTVNSKRTSLLTIWRHASRKGMARRFDWDDIPRMKLPRKNPTSWTAPQVAAILSNVRRPWLNAFCQFLYETGCRLGAAEKLTWDDWDENTRTIILRAANSKTNLEQIVRVSECLAKKIEGLRKSHAGRIFPVPANKRFIRRELRNAVKAAKLPATRRDSFQKFRRTCASLMASIAGVEAAAFQLGHSDSRTTRTFYIDPRMLPTIHASDVLPPL